MRKHPTDDDVVQRLLSICMRINPNRRFYFLSSTMVSSLYREHLLAVQTMNILELYFTQSISLSDGFYSLGPKVACENNVRDLLEGNPLFERIRCQSNLYLSVSRYLLCPCKWLCPVPHSSQKKADWWHTKCAPVESCLVFNNVWDQQRNLLHVKGTILTW